MCPDRGVGVSGDDWWGTECVSCVFSDGTLFGLGGDWRFGSTTGVDLAEVAVVGAAGTVGSKWCGGEGGPK